MYHPMVNLMLLSNAMPWWYVFQEAYNRPMWLQAILAFCGCSDQCSTQVCVPDSRTWTSRWPTHTVKVKAEHGEHNTYCAFEIQEEHCKHISQPHHSPQFWFTLCTLKCRHGGHAAWPLRHHFSVSDCANANMKTATFISLQHGMHACLMGKPARKCE